MQAGKSQDLRRLTNPSEQANKPAGPLQDDQLPTSRRLPIYAQACAAELPLMPICRSDYGRCLLGASTLLTQARPCHFMVRFSGKWRLGTMLRGHPSLPPNPRLSQFSF
jgi:hypothetical protein